MHPEPAPTDDDGDDDDETPLEPTPTGPPQPADQGPEHDPPADAPRLHAWANRIQQQPQIQRAHLGSAD